MSGRVAYLERVERGFRPSAIRLVGERSDERLALEPDGQDGDRAALTRAADWIRQRVPRGAPGLDVLCLDTDGSLCSWLSSPSAEPGVVAALARQGSGEGWAGPQEGSSAADVLGSYAGLAQESSVQALALAPAASRPVLPGKPGVKDTGEPARQRLAVVVTPDATARVLLDELDLRAVKVGSVCSLWHAIAAAWDPSGAVHARAVGAMAEGGGGRVVAESAAVHATVLADPRGRLLWSWSGHAGLLAGGSIRLRALPAVDQQTPGVVVGPGDLSRLAAAWLSWSAQLGCAPVRVTCVVPETVPGEGSLDPRGIGEALTRAWPGTTVDLAVDNDPIGATLRRLAVAGSASQDAGEATLSPEDPASSLVNLTQRPGRAHFRLYLWSASTLVAAAIGISAAAIMIWSSALQARRAAIATREQWLTAFQTLKPPGEVYPGQEIPALKAELARVEIATHPVMAAEPAMPVLQELETLSYVLGFEGVHLDEITLDSRLVKPRIVCQVASIPDGEALFGAIKQISGSNVIGWTPSYTLMGGKTKCVFQGSWAVGPRPGAGGSGS